ncbi:Core-2/I-Branching enzyme [Loktanella fryxellensis]|uniref:Peptide O-xylosyltransferase n=1 Tax=Loktanella fryxellensis TaxID=245187 RepID=A0A1H8DQN4_9RHOB|nr:beta-1,6-N-acetylglucosaminyltransferase [Loktanella fryxellensis]SEN09641.1 Core-2/I-Branching enzyme [Loktanella fryxellensis]
MTLGIVMLVHADFDRAEQLARHWVAGGCPVVIHVDRKVRAAQFERFRAALADQPTVLFSTRHRCEWGAWGIVAATQAASELMLARFTQVRHVYLTSGSCMPLRPVADLRRYLDSRPRTDFIESATTADVPWTVGGLDHERFTLQFPFSWRRQRKLFDRYVALQRRVGYQRRIPDGIVPHMGSQWWCMTRQTLSAILGDPDRRRNDAYFAKVWIPDESYFQSLARLYSVSIESRSLTLSKFDFQGKPHIFYDDHLQLLRRSDCFVARKIWPRGDRLYGTFLKDDATAMTASEPNPGKIDRIFSKAVDLRTKGRPGLYMQSRWPRHDRENGITSGPYAVFGGLAELFENFEPWLAKATGMRVHGHLFNPHRVEFDGRQKIFNGALTDNPAIREYDSQRFLTNLIWNTRGERQAFQFSPADTQGIRYLVARDQNAYVCVVSGVWAVPLFQSNGNFGELRHRAAHLQRVESEWLDILRSPWTKARVRIWTMADFIDSPMEALQQVVDDLVGGGVRRLNEAPRMHDLTGFGQFLQNLKNQGMHPHLMGDFPVGSAPLHQAPKPRKPYLVN